MMSIPATNTTVATGLGRQAARPTHAVEQAPEGRPTDLLAGSAGRQDLYPDQLFGPGSRGMMGRRDDGAMPDAGHDTGPVVSADDAEGEQRWAAAVHQLGDLMPVQAIGVGLRQRGGDPQTREPGHAPAVH